MKQHSSTGIKRHPIAFSIGILLALVIVLSLVWNLELWPLAVFALPYLVATALYTFDIAKRYSRWRIAGFIAVGITAFCLCLPYYLNVYKVVDGNGDVILRSEWSAWLMSIQHALRLFVLDGDFGEIVEHHLSSAAMPEFYAAFSAFLCFFAPLLTFTLLLSIVKNLTAKGKYVIGFFRRVHVFSELNEKSLALAKSLIDYPEDDLIHATEQKQKRPDKKGRPAPVGDEGFDDIDKNVVFPATDGRASARRRRLRLRPLIVFTDVLDKHEEEHYELIAEAKEINAILFRKDLESVRFRVPLLLWRKLSFYLISEDESEKIRHAKHIMQKYNDERTQLFVFSNNIETQLLLDSSEQECKLSKRRIDDIQSLIYHNLDQHGLRLFRNAQALHSEKFGKQSGTRAVITAVIVGLGQYGMEMLKALLWYCQMVGFRLEIHAFDERENASSRLYALCPELKRPAERTDGKNEWEDDYYPTVYDHVAVDTDEFAQRIKAIKDATFVFVGLGSDELNISTAIHIRTLYAQINREPDIETVVYDSNVSRRMSMSWERDGETGVKNSAGQSYKIHMTGDLESFYSAKTLLRSDLDEAGKICELRWTFSSLLGKRDEIEVLTDAKQIVESTDGFDSNVNLILFEKKLDVKILSQKEKYYTSIVNVKDLYAALAAGRALNNLSAEHCAALCALIDETAKGKHSDQPLPADPIARLAAAKESGETVFVHEDVVSEKMILNTAYTSRPEGSDPDTPTTFEEKICALEKKIQAYSEELRSKNPIGYRKHEYNYRASLTRAVRDRMRQTLLLSGDSEVEIAPDGCWTQTEIDHLIKGLGTRISERTLDQMAAIGKLEHVAWNAYMRTEGFSWGAQTNRLAKLHCCIKPVSALDAKELRKDA